MIISDYIVSTFSMAATNAHNAAIPEWLNYRRALAPGFKNSNYVPGLSLSQD